MKVEKGKKKNKSGKGSKEINNDTKKSKGEIDSDKNSDKNQIEQGRPMMALSNSNSGYQSIDDIAVENATDLSQENQDSEREGEVATTTVTSLSSLHSIIFVSIILVSVISVTLSTLLFD